LVSAHAGAANSMVAVRQAAINLLMVIGIPLRF
jgi:hypothetical protein